jgi:hypothetical protein
MKDTKAHYLHFERKKTPNTTSAPKLSSSWPFTALKFGFTMPKKGNYWK